MIVVCFRKWMRNLYTKISNFKKNENRSMWFYRIKRFDYQKKELEFRRKTKNG